MKNLFSFIGTILPVAIIITIFGIIGQSIYQEDKAGKAENREYLLRRLLQSDIESKLRSRNVSFPIKVDTSLTNGIERCAQEVKQEKEKSIFYKMFKTEMFPD